MDTVTHLEGEQLMKTRTHVTRGTAVENLDAHLEYAAALRQSLADETLAEIDLDAVVDWLAKLRGTLTAAARLSAEHNSLRADYVSRIAGMARAVAVVRSRSDSRFEVAEYLDRLPSLSADELVVEHRRVSARFRDSFPSSFGDRRFTGVRSRKPSTESHDQKTRGTDVPAARVSAPGPTLSHS